MREPTAHAGEECGVVLEGMLDVEVPGVTSRLAQGDGIWFLSTQARAFRPADGSESLSVCADTIPGARKRGTAPRASVDDFLGPEDVVAIDAART